MPEFETNTAIENLLMKFSASFDFIHRELDMTHTPMHIYFFASLCDISLVEQFLIKPYYDAESEINYEFYLQSLPGFKTIQNPLEIESLLWSGHVLLQLDNELYIFKINQPSPTSSPAQSNIEAVVLGPNVSFTESISENMKILRHRYLSETLRTEFLQLGHPFKLSVALVYDLHAADQETLRAIKARLSQFEGNPYIRMDQVQQLLSHNKWGIFPSVMMTQRPDRTIKYLLEGKIALMAEGLSNMYIVPVSFFDFFMAMDDLYQISFIGKVMAALRYVGLSISVLLPSVYVVLISFNPELLRLELALPIAGSRVLVPYPSFLEVLFMLLMMELLAEASIRLPRLIGPAATTVGGLILGQAVTQAGLASSIMIIIVSSVAISNFIIPNYSMSFSVRIIKYPLLILSTLFGAVGFLGGIVMLVFHLANIPNYGKPYLQIFSGVLSRRTRGIRR